jgi:hypothetical protein
VLAAALAKQVFAAVAAVANRPLAMADWWQSSWHGWEDANGQQWRAPQWRANDQQAAVAAVSKPQQPTPKGFVLDVKPKGPPPASRIANIPDAGEFAVAAGEVYMLTLDDLKEQREVPSHHSDHSGVLKYVRYSQEYDSQGTKELSLGERHNGLHTMPFCIHPKGQNYSFSHTETIQWCAGWFLSNLRDQDIDKVVQGPSGRGRGITKVVLSNCDNAPGVAGQYDHKREAGQKHGHATWKYEGKLENRLHQWDFVITRDDGSSCWLHPNWSNIDVDYGEVLANAVKLEPPASGRGGSNGRGTYRHYREARTEEKLKLDRNKNTVKDKHRKPKLEAALAAQVLAAVAAVPNRPPPALPAKAAQAAAPEPAVAAVPNSQPAALPASALPAKAPPGPLPAKGLPPGTLPARFPGPPPGTLPAKRPAGPPPGPLPYKTPPYAY